MRIRWLAAAGLVVVFAVVIVALLMAHHAGTGHRSQPIAAPSTAPAPPLSPQRASALAAALGTGSDAGLRAAVALPAGQELTPGAAQQIAELGPITFDLSSFHDNHDGTATVGARMGHPAPGTSPVWTAQLIDEAGEWKISLTDSAP